ncbi:MAG TPA: RodZ domain-containing protein [Vicinamibacterales bacterium]|nr:RodZ domain-containing protein [Vicinamibacterales bacterium]
MPERTTGGVGAKLRDARERRGVSLRQIANATKISIGALEALERNDISRLPGGIFSRAFVRSYAVEVGLDPEAMIQEFIEQFPNDSVIAGHPTSDQIEDHQAVESERRTAGTFLWLALVSVPLAGAVVYFATAGRPLIRDASPPVAADAPRPSEPSRPAAIPPPVPATTPAPAPSSATPAQAAAPVAPAAASPGSTPAAVAPAVSPAPTSSGATAADVADHLTAQLSASRPCWVTATVDGKRSIDRLLPAGERMTIDARRELVLTVGDAAGVALTLNGADARPLGKSGEVVTARINLTNFKTYLSAR